jgi:hypothetical protein
MPTYPIALPPKAPATERLTPLFRQAAMASPYTLKQQTVNTASQWQLEFTWPRMTAADAEKCAAWLDSLSGQVGTFRYSPRQAYASALTGRTLAQSAFADTSAVRLAGWPANSASGLRVGQLFQLGTQLLRIITAPSQADANGRCIVEFSTPLRANFNAGAAVDFTSPEGLFRLSASEGNGYTLTPDRLPDFGTIVAKEAVE